MRRLGADPDLVTVLIGSNDIVSSRRRRYLSIDYGELLRALPPGTVVASPFANFGLGRELNALLAQEAADRGLRIVNSHDGTNLASWKGKLAEDHFHPNDAGYAALAQDFFKAIQEPP
jgi:lysophospholipase L1-like esterase